MIRTRILALGFIFPFLFLSQESSWALVTGTNQQESLPNFPPGTEAVANHYSRIGGWTGPLFDYTLYFRVLDASEFNEVLQLYSQIEHPRLELILKSREENSTPRGAKPRKVVDWSLVLHGVTKNPDYDPALIVIKLTAYMNGGNINWDQVTIPENLIVKDERREGVQEEAIPGIALDESDFDPDPPLLEKDWSILQLSGNEVDFSKRGFRWNKWKEGDLISTKKTIDFRWDAVYRLHKVDEANQRVFLERLWDEGIMGWVYKDGRVELMDQVPE